MTKGAVGMQISNCEICGSTNTRSAAIRPGLEYLICQTCGHCLLVPGDASLDDTFVASQEKYFGEDTVLIEAGHSPMEDEVMARRRAVFARFVKSPSALLEVGPGAGVFLNWACTKGHTVTAIEDSPVLARAVEAKTGAQVIIGRFESICLPDASQDVFCSFHVIEHVTDPRAHFGKAARVVRPGGLAFVATPNATSWEQRLFCRLSPNFDSAHLRVFSAQSLQRLAAEAGWHVLYAETPEYTSGWLRVVSKVVRKLRGEDEEATAGKYASHLPPGRRWILAVLRGLSSPLRTVQSRLQGGNEILLVLQRNA